MHQNLDFIYTLTGGLLAAVLFGFITQRLKLSPIVGYLLGGIAIGPFTPGYVAKGQIAEQLAELGVILLMFGVGLHFHVKDLLAVRRVAIPGALVQIAVATGLGVLVAGAVGWSIGAGVVFGLAVAVASTVVLLRVLSDHDTLHTHAGHVAVGWLLVEDLFTVFVLVVLPIVATEPLDGNVSGILLPLGAAFLKVVALIAFVLFVARPVIPRLMSFVASTRSRELFTLTILALALGLSVGSATLFGASMALGAFLAGMVVGQSDFGTRAASEALPMRDAFAVLFFVSMGMLFDPAELIPNGKAILLTLALVVIGKPLAAVLVVLVLRYPAKTALSVAIALAQIGEFSFIVGALGKSLGVLPPEATQIMVAVSIASIAINPLLYKLVDPAARLLERLTPGRDPSIVPPRPAPKEHRYLVVGYGPVGQIVADILIESGLQPTIVELNHETVKKLRSQEIHALYGDATQTEVLEQAGIRQCAGLVFTAPGSPNEVIRAARALNPTLRILARTAYVTDIPALKKAGAHGVVTAEAEVALGMAVRVLEELGATRDQLDRVRHRVKTEVEAAS